MKTSKASTLSDHMVQKQISIWEFCVMVFQLKHASAEFTGSVGSCVL